MYIQMKDVVKKYGEGENTIFALDHASLELEKGEMCVILGPSGSGKSTLLNMLGGLDSADDGTIIVDGCDLSSISKKELREYRRNKVGIVFQTYNLIGEITVRENIKVVRDISAAPLSIEELLKDLGLERHAAHFPEQLSGGQQQRVAIARALVTEPAIICLDEPLSNLDAKLRVQLRLELKKMQKDFGITSIYVTHDQEEALTLSDRIAVFNKGVIEQIGTPNEIYNHSATEFVCNFIGDINRLSDDIVEKLNAKGAQLDPTHHHYIRLERVHVNDAQHAESGAVSLSGTVESREYYGLYIKYYINVGSQTLKVIERNDGVHLHDTGDAVTVTVHPDDLMSYAPNGEEAEK